MNSRSSEELPGMDNPSAGSLVFPTLALSRNFELLHLWLFVFLYGFLHLGGDWLAVPWGDPTRVRVVFSFFVVTTICSALLAWQGFRLVPIGGLARDVCYFFAMSLLFASAANTLDLLFWLLNILPLKSLTVVNGMIVVGIVFGMMGMWKLCRLCKAEFRSESVVLFLVLSVFYVWLPTLINDQFYSMALLGAGNYKEALFGVLYSIIIAGISSIAFQIWFFARGQVVPAARLFCLGTFLMGLGCTLYGVLFSLTDVLSVAGNPVHLILGLGYLLLGLGSLRLGQTSLAIFSYDSQAVAPSQPLIDLLGPGLGTKVYEAMLGKIRESQADLLRVEDQKRQKDELISALEQEIQHRKEVEEELQKAKTMAENANRAKSQFLAVMSHEFRTPLTPIRAYSLLIGDPEGPVGKKLSPDVRDLGTRIYRSAIALENLINSILEFSRAESGLPREVLEEFTVGDLCVFAREYGETLAGEKSVAFALESLDEALPLRGDRQALQLIISNLLGNAFKFTRQGRVEIRFGRNGQEFCLQVADTGPGIPTDLQEKVFEPFFQGSSGLSRKFTGIGLGLCIVKRLVSSLGGVIRLDSKPDEGTRVSVGIPNLLEPWMNRVDRRPLPVEEHSPSFE